jgi:hypothetical protein
MLRDPLNCRFSDDKGLNWLLYRILILWYSDSGTATNAKIEKIKIIMED